MPKFPNLHPEDFDAAVAAAARCHTMRHYFEFDSSAGWTPAFGYGVTYRCVNCGGYRYDTHSPLTDDLLCRSYDMAPWYSEAKMSHAEWRSAYLAQNAKVQKRAESGEAHRLPGVTNRYPRENHGRKS